ncbi:hypothetical protein BCR33DRAFT_723922 [Rhizoclosmatium globosum]|uniref:CRAL-TRIO domain-containing protein n=1 Tax=Rhizoclosmatium globosum TaxID=329046 RepID=A0A1Y2B9S9_9FUNG|nr:hypothetical protein BCR33DRAFT_723922 [Rhizoclosmatium globosum]|eukprot:ORY31573.1 hypothetical protein BCR33DRAFT_723922 [Rhizoclosmatium globosum]
MIRSSPSLRPTESVFSLVETSPNCLISSHSAKLLRIVTKFLVGLEANPSFPPGSLAHIAALISDPAFLFRYAFKFNLDEELTVKGLMGHVQWRLEEVVGASLSQKAKEYLDAGIFRFHGQDHLSRPTLLISLSRYNAAAEKPYLQDFKACLIHVLETGRRCIYAVNDTLAKRNRDSKDDWRVTEKSANRLVHQLSVIVDLEGVGLANVDYAMMPVIMSIFSNHYPGIFGTLYVLNFGWLHSGIWSIIKRALSEEACNKLLFLTKKEMLQYFDANSLLQEHGGLCKTSNNVKILTKYGHDTILQPPLPPHLTKTLHLIHQKTPTLFQSELTLSLLPPPTPAQTISLQNNRTALFRSPRLVPTSTGSIQNSPFLGADAFFTPLMNPLTSPSMDVWFDAPDDISAFLLSPAMPPVQRGPAVLFSPGMRATLHLPGAGVVEMELPESVLGEDVEGESTGTVVEASGSDDGFIPQTPSMLFAGTLPPQNGSCDGCGCCKGRGHEEPGVLEAFGVFVKAVVRSPWTFSLAVSKGVVNVWTGEISGKAEKALAVVLLGSVVGAAVWKYGKFLNRERVLSVGAVVAGVLGQLGVERLGDLVGEGIEVSAIEAAKLVTE